MDNKERRRRLFEIFKRCPWVIDTLLDKDDEDMFLGIHPVENYDPKDFDAIIDILKKEPPKRISGKPYT